MLKERGSNLTKAKVKNKITDVPDSTWSAVHTGMRNVVLLEYNDIFSSLNHTNLAISGKTGTAQQGKTHPDHGLFVGFAPSNSPEVAWAIRIANGYSSSRAAEVGKRCYEILLQQRRQEEDHHRRSCNDWKRFRRRLKERGGSM